MTKKKKIKVVTINKGMTYIELKQIYPNNNYFTRTKPVSVSGTIPKGTCSIITFEVSSP